MDTGESLQREYYGRTASVYEAQQIHPGDEHEDALEHMAEIIGLLGARTALDTGCGTGRGLRFLRTRFPDLVLRGNDPSSALLRVAVEHGIPETALVHASTLDLTDRPGSYDVVIAIGVLHHVPDPDAVVAKMISLARKAVLISDSNYLGQGRWPIRVLKIALTACGLWRWVKFVQQGFKPYGYNEGDGVFYSYSAFSSLPLLCAACREVRVISTGPLAERARRWPRMMAPHVLLCGLK